VSSRGGALVRTARGWRSPEAAVGFGERALQRELVQVLCPRAAATDPVDWGALIPEPRASIRSRLRRILEEDATSERGRQAIEELAAQGHPDDLALLMQVRTQSGRRTDHVVLIGLGRLGDPRALPTLERDLDRMDIDPGRAFAWRRLIALAMGRMGVRDRAPRLLRALEVEATYYEGRPGAGLGIQFPVRSNLLWGLGELQAPRAARTLVGYLANLHGSALGGFYLPAMGALIKLGAPAVPALTRAAREDGEIAALNAVGALEAIGARQALEEVARGDGASARSAADALRGAERPAAAWRAR
jgi:HEAT repeat protein